MIKVPGTAERIPAFQQLISEGININVTLLFAEEVYVRVAEAYVAGLEQFAARGGDVSRIASVPSFLSAASTLWWIHPCRPPQDRQRPQRAGDAEEPWFRFSILLWRCQLS